MTDPRPLPVSQIRLYRDWLQRTHGLAFADYPALWRWSVDEPEAFWMSVWRWRELRSPIAPTRALADARMPGARWFPGTRVNYAAQVLRHVDAAAAAGVPAIVCEDERGRVRELSWPQLQRQVASFAAALARLGVRRGDRVVACLPNTPETAVAFLACAAIGAVWSVCAPDMGVPAMVDRFRQIEPVLLIAADGVRYAGRDADRSDAIAALRAALPSVRKLMVLESGLAGSRVPCDATVAEALQADADAGWQPEWLPFDHPLWIVYSSGTTGLPKAIVHGHGGVLLMAAAGSLHFDTGASYEANTCGERFHWYSTTGWIMWNLQVAALLTGTTVCLYDGSPGGAKDAPDWTVLWRFAARQRVSFLGAGAAFFTQCMKAGVDLADCGDLSRVRALGATGSPLPEAVERWGVEQFERLGMPGMWWCNVSGGTDFAGAFIAGCRDLPATPGRMQCRQLGAAVEAWDEAGRPLVGEVGELVCTQPLPSMPLYFWNDPDGRRLHDSYFDTYPGVWRHGDWLRIDADGACTIHGRSDATLNRHGLRLGTSEIYAAVEALPEVLDSMVIDIEHLGRESWMVLFVVPRGGVQALDDALRERIARAIRQAVSARFVPDAIVAAAEIPRTLSGKKMELPVKKLFLGQPAAQVVQPGVMANPQCLDWYVAQAAQRAAR